ncbi:MAG TPA: Nramp family divalent metal transporter [Acidobacteriaceae bacterium]|jgi:manganese transport protein|nr:Nramp family divalent metal transporter [Acidobacteriaceae bacterium]
MAPASPPSLPVSSSTPAALLSDLKSRQFLSWFGPAFVASIAYIDPGNFGTNLIAGTGFGYKLLWVLLWSNLMAILIQYLSAKLGIATGATLPENCREHFSRRTAIGLWVAAELSAMATDLAEFLGAALGFYLLFGGYFLHLGLASTTVMCIAAVVSAVCVFAILALELRGFRTLEIGIMVFVLVIGVCYLIEIFLVHPDWRQIAYHTAVPWLDRPSIYVAVSMLGATVMPHVVYLHSGLVQPRLKEQERHLAPSDDRYLSRLRHLHLEALDVFTAMNGAWLVNSAMVIVAAAAFAGTGRSDMSIEEAHRTLGPLLGPASATIFAIALLCSGLSSSTVGTLAGQMILEGFLKVRFSIFLRRLLTLLPAMIVIGLGLDPLRILVLSQVVLSFTLPFALVPLLILCSRPRLMGGFTNGPIINFLGWLTVGLILALNVVLLGLSV